MCSLFFPSYYDNTGHGSSPNVKVVGNQFEVGDKIGCGIDVQRCKFREDGTLEPGQTLIVYFMKNGTKVGRLLLRNR